MGLDLKYDDHLAVMNFIFALRSQTGWMKSIYAIDVNQLFTIIDRIILKMIDGIRWVIRNAGHIMKKTFLDFRRFKKEVFKEKGAKEDEDTNEEEEYVIAKSRGLIFKLYDNGTLIVRGSLHKYYDGFDNCSDFEKTHIIETLNYIQDVLGLHLRECELQNTEFGINMFTANCQELVDCPIEHRGQIYSTEEEGLMRRCKKSEREIKIYYKGRLDGQNIDDLLRIENGYKRARRLHDFNICTLQDLLDFNWVPLARDQLIKSLNDTLMFDFTLDKSKVGEENYLRWSNPKFWRELGSESKNRVKKCRELRKYNNAVREHSCNIKEELIAQIEQKINQLYM